MSEYSKTEEKLNVYSHILGVILGLIALVLLSVKSSSHYDLKSQISFLIFALSMILLYTASSLYHNEKNLKQRLKKKVLDHCAIYILIAGTYTPFTLVALGGKLGWIVFSISWLMAIIGIILKIFFTGRFKLVSTLMYVFMGWMIIFFIKPLMLVFSQDGFSWLLYGGISYSLGAVFYMIKKIKFNHAIFHIFVLGGSICHFISIYKYM